MNLRNTRGWQVIPIDFHNRNLIAERRIALLGRITERGSLLLSAAAFVFLAAHAGLAFFSWPESKTATAAGDVQAASVQGSDNE